jgi:hypothetical protein
MLFANFRRTAMPDNFHDDLIDVLEAVSKAQLDALRRLRRSAAQPIRAGDAKGAKSMSQVDMAYDILRSANRPLHISEIISLVAKRHGTTLDRESIVSALSKRVARKDRFVRTAPNTFALLLENER